MRQHWEVSLHKIGCQNKWWQHPKGGPFRKWYGNVDWIIDWSEEARIHYRKDKVARILPEYLWGKKGISWTLITSGQISFRILKRNQIFNLAAPSLFFHDEDNIEKCLAYLNTRYVEKLLQVINPTLNMNVGEVRCLPLLSNIDLKEKKINGIVVSCLKLSRNDWNSYETSWDFTTLPILHPDHGTTVHVKSLEEEEYPQYFGAVEDQKPEAEAADQAPEQSQVPAAVSDTAPELKERQVIVKENQRGVTFDKLFSDYLQDAGKITVTDSYIRIYYQIRNFMEFIETIVRIKPKDDEVDVHLITVQDDFKGPQQIDSFIKIQENCAIAGVHFTWEFDETKTLHARHIVTDHGWKILLDRGLDIFQHYEINDSFSLSNRLQQYRSCKAFEITYLKTKG
ncbi:MIT C-terminal domain-containing protein [Desulfobacter sp.]